jgi:peptide/nickel transport system substrate-binding protein
MDSGIVEELGPDWATKASAGTGPFKFVEWNRGQNVKLAAHEDYWGGAPAIDGVNFLIVPSGDTAVSMYEAAELDLVYADPATIRRILKDPQFEGDMITSPAAQIQYLGMNQTQYEPFEDIRVREAVCKSLDRHAMIEGLYDGAAFILNGQVTPGVAGYNPDLPEVPYAPDEAKALMADAGYPDGEGLPPVKVTTTEPNKNLATYVASQMNEVLGMPAEVEVVERGSHIKNMNAGEVAFFHWGWSAGYPDALYFLSQVWYGPSIYNRSRWQNDEFDALIEKAGTVADNEERYKLYNQAEQILVEDWGTCPTTVRMQVALKKPNVEGVHLIPFRFLPFSDVEIN